LNSAVSSLKKPDRALSLIPKKEIRAKLNMHGLREGRAERAIGALAEFIGATTLSERSN